MQALRCADPSAAVGHAARELPDDVDDVVIGQGIWVAVLGSQLVSSAIKDDPVARLARAWRLILRWAAPAGYEDLLDALTTQYSPDPAANPSFSVEIGD